MSGDDRNQLLDRFAGMILGHHPRLAFDKLPTGWCSWYCFGPRVTAERVRQNVELINQALPQLHYVQIDDGYQPWMGDWLSTGSAFGGDVRQVLGEIGAAGLGPAIWVAPFVASPESELFARHPDWFVKDEAGRPLRSDTVTFGGWRKGPWYMLDGTHPGAQAYLEGVFRTMREQWGCTYFKLDANAWGAMPFGKLHDPEASHVEAYRRGMAAIRRGAGEDAFLLGCNHPIWPSLGEVHASRSSMDIKRSWERIERVARENILRNWQNDRLWWNDPDCLVLTGDLPANELSFHIAATYASGGMMLSGDDLTRLDDGQRAVIQSLVRELGPSAVFASLALEVGIVEREHDRVAVLLNWDQRPGDRRVELPGPARVTDLFTGEDLGVHRGAFELPRMPGRSGRLLVLTPVSAAR